MSATGQAGHAYSVLDGDDAPITKHRTTSSVGRAQMMLAADEGRSASLDGDGASEDEADDPQSEIGHDSGAPTSVGGHGTVASSSRPIGRVHPSSGHSTPKRPAWDAQPAYRGDGDGTAVPSDLTTSLVAMEQDVAALYHDSSPPSRFASPPPPPQWQAARTGRGTAGGQSSGTLPLTVDACHHAIRAQRGQIVELAARVAQLEQIAESLREQNISIRAQSQHDLSSIAIMRERVAAGESEIHQLRSERDDLLQQRLEQTRRARDAATRATELQSALSSLDRDRAFGFASGKAQAVSLSLFGTASPAGVGGQAGISPSARAARAAIANRAPNTISTVVPTRATPSGATYRPPPSRVSGIGGGSTPSVPALTRSSVYGAPVSAGGGYGGGTPQGFMGAGSPYQAQRPRGYGPSGMSASAYTPPAYAPAPAPPSYDPVPPADYAPAGAVSRFGSRGSGAPQATVPQASARQLLTGAEGGSEDGPGIPEGVPLSSVPFFQSLLDGIPIIKHSAWPAKPKHQLVWLDVSAPREPTFCWGPPAERAHPVDSKRLSLLKIRTLNTGLASKRLERYGTAEHAGRYMTFAGYDRSLDLEFATEDDRTVFFDKSNALFRAFAEAIQGGMEGDAVIAHVAQQVDGGAVAGSPGKRPSFRG